MHGQVHPTVSDTKPMSHGSPHRYFTGSGEQRTSFSLFISETILGWHGPTSHSADQLKNGTLGSLPSASANITWAILPNSSEEEHGSQPEPEVSAPFPPIACVRTCSESDRVCLELAHCFKRRQVIKCKNFPERQKSAPCLTGTAPPPLDLVCVAAAGSQLPFYQ